MHFQLPTSIPASPDKHWESVPSTVALGGSDLSVGLRPGANLSPELRAAVNACASPLGFLQLS